MSIELHRIDKLTSLWAIRKFVSICETGRGRDRGVLGICNLFIIPPSTTKVGTRRNRSLPPSLPPCFVFSSTELGVFSKLVDFNNFEMSVVRSEGSCVAIRNLSPSTSINRSCAHGSASSGILFLLTLAWRPLPFDPLALISSSVST